jgi:hypothetical protein
MSEEPGAATRFVILSAPRSGSNLLCTLLNSHPEILCHHEVYNPSGIYYALDCRNGCIDLGTIEERDRSPLDFLMRLWSRRLGHSCVGFKMTRGQNELVLAKVLRDPEVRKIVLKRRNRIKTYVSSLIAERSGQWEAYNEAELAGPKPKIELEIDQFHHHIRVNELYYDEIDAILRSTNQGALAVTYENLVNSSEAATMLSYLGIGCRSCELVPASVKQNPTDLRLLISNYDEVSAELEGGELYEELYSTEP